MTTLSSLSDWEKQAERGRCRGLGRKEQGVGGPRDTVSTARCSLLPCGPCRAQSCPREGKGPASPRASSHPCWGSGLRALPCPRLLPLSATGGSPTRFRSGPGSAPLLGHRPQRPLSWGSGAQGLLRGAPGAEGTEASSLECRVGVGVTGHPSSHLYYLEQQRHQASQGSGQPGSRGSPEVPGWRDRRHHTGEQPAGGSPESR